MIEYRDFITRKMLVAERDKLFVFGDNLARKGLGGQAKEMRGEPNALGIPTKRYPGMEMKDFLYDADFVEWANTVHPIMQKLSEHIKSGGTVVWPTRGIGTGLARLKWTSPKIFVILTEFENDLRELAETYGS